MTIPNHASNSSRIYPGLNDSNIEFFNIGDQLKVFSNGKMKDFQELPFGIQMVLKDALLKLPNVLKILTEWHPNSEMKRLEQFTKCRYGGLDFKPDIENLELGAPEYWDCPFRGKCKGEGVVCKQLMYNNQILTPTDIKAIRLLSTSNTNEVIAEALEMPMGTFNQFKKDLYKKLNVQTKQEVVVIAIYDLNIL